MYFSCRIEEIPENREIINQLNYGQIIKLKQTADESEEWFGRDLCENYRNAMRVRCTEELRICVNRNLEKFTYDLNVNKSGVIKKYNDILDDENKITTSEPKAD